MDLKERTSTQNFVLRDEKITVSGSAMQNTSRQ